PKWMVDGFGMLSSRDRGPEWSATILEWTRLERAYGFQHSTKPLPTAGRPKVIHEWTKGGRSTTKTPSKFVLTEHISSWRGWWDGIAPSWRVRDGNGCLLTEKEGPWGDLVRPGGNGMLTVLLCLAWWYDGEGKTTEEWVAALKEVKWV
ncbi:hypothetical protein C8R46DRAFT_846704, partial [Mycena filopes]